MPLAEEEDVAAPREGAVEPSDGATAESVGATIEGWWCPAMRPANRNDAIPGRGMGLQRVYMGGCCARREETMHVQVRKAQKCGAGGEAAH